HVNPRGKTSHILRLSSYKVYDSHKDEKGFPDAHLPAGVLIINPMIAEQQGRVCFVADPELGADMLTFLRRHHAASKRVTV
ncbi:MAG: hypothetical protein KGL35_31725, partial [Bradyrhizobium sp.]|nr:hypothetical protein [Bradyrhizobium sp.]